MPERDFVTVVSGLPRSGTSMMMRMLQAGGLPAVVDHQRKADADNPGGYLEFEPVKALGEDHAWVDDARGKAVKVIYKLVYDLPAHLPYRVIFLERDLAEVLASQEAMLARMGRAAGPVGREGMAALFEAEMRAFRQWAAGQRHLKLLYIDYASIVADPLNAARRIEGFLGAGVDTHAMAGTVDPALYRQRA